MKIISDKDNLTAKASKGAVWSLASNIMVSAISFVGTAILARMLEPKDFGLMGMATLVTGVVALFGNFGLGAALIQKKVVTDEDLSTAFWANMGAGVVLAIACMFISPFAANFFRENAVMWVLICLAFNFVLSALCSVHSTLIYKRIHMRPLALIEVSGRVLRVVAMLIAAFCGLKFWSIVIGIIIERIYKSFVFFIFEKWRPRRVFSMKRFMEMFRFGRNLLAGGLLGYFNRNMDFLVTGRVLGVDLLGFYQMGYNLPNLLKGYVNDSIGVVSFPIFCKVQEDNVRLVRGFLRIVKFIAIGTFPILFGLSFSAHDFILVAYSAKWLPVVAPMQILCFAAAWSSVNACIGSLLNAKGRPDLALKWSCVRLIITIIAILYGVHFGGIIGVAFGMLFIEIVSLLFLYYSLRFILKSDFREYWKALFPAVIASLIMIFVLFGIGELFSMQGVLPWVRLLINFIVGASVYIMVIIFGFKEIFNDSLKFVRAFVVK